MSTLGGGFSPVAALLQNFGRRPDQQNAQQQQPTPGMLIWDFPVNGLHTNDSYRNQPPGTTPACLNVIAYDPSSNRARGGTRNGLTRVFATPQGNGVGAVQPVQQMGLYTFEQITNVLVADNFAYSPGQLAQVSGGEWQTYQDGTNGTGLPANGESSGERMFVITNAGAAGVTVGTLANVVIGTAARKCQTMLAAATLQSGVMGSVTNVSGTFTAPNDSTSQASNQYFAVGARMQTATFGDAGAGLTGLMAFMNLAGPNTSATATFMMVEISKDGSNNRSEKILATAAYPPNTWPNGLVLGTAASFDLNVSGNLATFEINGGTPVLSATTTINYGASVQAVAICSSFTHSTDTTSAGFNLPTSSGNPNVIISTNASGTLGMTTIFNDLFQYGGGTYLGVENTLWLTSTNGVQGQAGNGFFGVADNQWLTTGSNVTSTVAGTNTGTTPNNGGAYALYNATLNLFHTAGYDVSCTFEYGNGTGTASFGYFYELLKFGEPGSPQSANGLYLQFYCDNDGNSGLYLGIDR